MSARLPLWAAVPVGTLCGAAIGTIVAGFYLALALRTGVSDFDMLAVWTASAGLRAAHPEAFNATIPPPRSRPGAGADRGLAWY